MYLTKIDPMGPDIETTWGSYQSPFFVADQMQYANRGLIPIPPSQLRGPQPMWDQRMSTVTSSPFGATPTDEKWQLIILLGVVGLIAYLIGRGGSAKRNPSLLTYNEGESPRVHCPNCCPSCRTSAAPASAPAPRQRRRVSKRGKKTLRQIANARPRDALGRFI